MTRGLVIGKFNPPHRGHQHLIETALAQVDWLDVIVCSRPAQTIEGALRTAWLREMFPLAHVHEVDDLCDDGNSERWAEFIRATLGYAPNVVFTSEDRGERLAHFLGARHVMVDPEPAQLPISASEIRRDPLTNLQFLPPVVRAHFVKRVCVVGAESTGTTTLSRELAAHFCTLWVPEYGREYTEHKLPPGGDMSDLRWQTDEFVHIAQTQIAREQEAAGKANRVLICDTDALATAIWHERYVGHWPEAVDALARSRKYDLYLLTDCEIPFVQDGLRDGEHARQWMTNRFRDELTIRGLKWELVRGSREQRLCQAITAIELLWSEKPASLRD